MDVDPVYWDTALVALLVDPRSKGH